MFRCSGCGNECKDYQRARRYGRCQDCQRKATRARYARRREFLAAYKQEYVKRNADKVRAQRSAKRTKAADPAWRAAENAKQRAWRAANPKRVAEHARKGRKPGHDKEVKRKWLSDPENRAKIYASNAERRARQQTGLARFFRKEIAAIYAACPKGYHVDHIHPLKGKNLSGLHVPWNLQYLTPEENMRKHTEIT